MTQTNSPFHQVANSLLDKGYSVIPLAAKSKACFLKNWSVYTKSQSLSFLKEAAAEYNVGLVCGKASGLVALDFDNNVGTLHQDILKLVGELKVVKRGKKGGTVFFRYNGEKSKKWKKDGVMVVELLSDGTQTVLPPSIHPETLEPYVYTKVKTLLDTDINEIPFLPTDFIEKLDSLFEIKKDIMLGSNLDIVREALYFVKPDDYDTWLKCGMGLKNEFGDDGYKVWDQWSQSSEKYTPENLISKWESFKKDGITCASIFQLAIANGYIPPKDSGASFFNLGNAKLELDRWRLKGRPIGITTGIEPFDKLLHIRDNEFTLITGTPNSGKSEFLDFLIFSLIKDRDLKTMFASFEGEQMDHVEGFIQRYSGKTFEHRTSEEDERYLDKIKDKLFFYNQYAHRDLDAILERAKEIKDKKGLDILVIDPYACISVKENTSEFTAVKYTMSKLTSFAKKNKVHVFLVAHPKTIADKTKDGKPIMHNLYGVSGGANFYNLCDNGIIISREDREITVNIVKVRQQAIDSTGIFTMEYNKPTRSFINATPMF